MSKNNQDVLNRPIHLKMLIGFSLPTILSMVFMSIYTTVDGLFVARLVNTDALSAVNIVMPMVFIATGIGTMFGSGGNALVAKKIGEGKNKRHEKIFHCCFYVVCCEFGYIGFVLCIFKPLLRVAWLLTII